MIQPLLSVVTPTHNRRHSVVRMLDALRDGTFPVDQFEVIVVADGCIDDTVAVLSAATYPFPLRVIEQFPGGGAATARNAGVAVARGEIIVFIDDDIEPSSALLKTHARWHAERDDHVVIGAPIPVRAARASLGGIMGWRWWEQQFERMSVPGHRFAYDDIYTGILSLRSERFDKAGGFRGELHCREDAELGYRLIAGGARIVFDRAAGGLHHEVRETSRMVDRKRADGAADVLLVRRHPELWTVLHLAWPLLAPWWVLGFLRRIAFRATWLGDVISQALLRLLALLEYLKLRGTWRKAEGALIYYNYWRGVASVIDWSSFNALAEHAATIARAHAAQVEAAALDLDLGAGLDAVEQQLDAAKPHAIRLRVGAFPIGTVGYVPAAEPLRGVHLRRILMTRFGARMSIALNPERDLLVSHTRCHVAPTRRNIQGSQPAVESSAGSSSSPSIDS